MNICMIGHGMMGNWHSQALAGHGCVLHTLVGRREEPTRAFAEAHGYRHWTLSLDEALPDPEIDTVIVASPSEQHPDHAVRSLAAGKHTLIEIPLAMSLADAERVVEVGEASGKTYGLCHPMRFRRERDPLKARLLADEETLRHIAGRFFIKRLTNVGATGYERSWTDNILWHHFCHFVDLACWLYEGREIARVQGYLGQPHEKTGVPMECIVQFETDADQSALVHGSYHASFRLYDKLLVTDRDTYSFDILEHALTSSAGTTAMEDEQTNCARVVDDFLKAIKEGRSPRASGPSVLPAMRVLQAVQDDWDRRHGARDLPGRALS